MSYPRTKETAKPLFKVITNKPSNTTRNGVRDSDIKECFYATQETIDFIRKYHTRTDIIDIVAVDALWPKNAVIELTSSSYRSCYATAGYKITADDLLTEDDLAVLRAQDCFMSGQETGLCNINTYEIVNDKYVYSAHSVCDSGD